MIRLIFSLLLLALLSSCISLYDITVKDDGSAFVKTGRFSKDNIERYFHSDIITNIDTNTVQLAFEISNIDSLGYYLSLLEPGFIEFRMKSNELIMDDGHTGKVFTFDDKSIVRVNFYLHFDHKINLKYKSGRVTKNGENSVYITKSRRKLLKGDKKMQAVIEFIPYE